MTKSLTIKSHFTAEIPNLFDLFARKFSALKTLVVSVRGPTFETTLSDQQKYDCGESDLRPIVQFSNTKLDHQNSLDAMLMRGF